MNIRTIRKNTKEAQALADTLTRARVYSLSNDFVGADVEPRYAFEALHKFDFSKLTERDGIYCVHVHSNLWYELTGGTDEG